MTVIALGMPGHFSAWGFEALHRLCRSVGLDATPQWVDRFDAFDVEAAAPVLACSQFPSKALRAILPTGRMPVVMFLVSPLEAVQHQFSHHPGSLLEATRTVSASVALLSDCAVTQNTLLLSANEHAGARDLLLELARHIGIDVSDAALDDMVAAIGEPSARAGSVRPLSRSDESLVTLVLESSVSYLHGRNVPIRAVWPHRVFFSGDRPNEEAPLVTEATGGSRVLYYGPYLHLAEGCWRAKLTLGFSKDAVGLPLKVSAFGSGTMLGGARLLPRREGAFTAQFSFSVDEPEHPVEFHLRTEEGAIEGRIAFEQVELIRVA